jgi:hypothetical protein
MALEKIRRYHVGEARSASGEAWASKEALQETNDKESGKAFCQCRSNTEKVEDGEGNNVDRVTADVGDFAERRKKKRPKSICRLSSAYVKITWR